MSSTVEVIAEVAQGFEGRPEQASLLLKAAASAGADAVKYQLIYADELAAPDYKHYALFRSLEMSDDVWVALAAQAATLGIQLQLDIFGTRSLALAERLKVGAVKLHGTDISNIALLEAVAKSDAPRVLLGAGGSHRSELERALTVLAAKPVVVLLGFQAYPTPDETNQIARVRQLAAAWQTRFPQVQLGFADHVSPEGPVRDALAAVAMGAGATVIEKHLTLGRSMQLEDFESALNPDEFRQFVATMRGCAAALGQCADADDFAMSAAEVGYRQTIRRHVVAARDLPAGATLSPQDLVLKRTPASDAVTDLQRAYGAVIPRALAKDAPLLVSDLPEAPR